MKLLFWDLLKPSNKSQNKIVTSFNYPSFLSYSYRTKAMKTMRYFGITSENSGLDACYITQQ